MPDLLRERRMTLAELAQQQNVNTCTTWRWSGRGVGGVVLETYSVGGRRYTSQEAFERFVERTTAAAQRGPSLPTIRTTRQREAAIRKADAELAKAGI
ncbi:MAG: hypothetical protein C0485_04345 [Pirellula sp.]|nr:hypothetical protein [Pirellula sp.]